MLLNANRKPVEVALPTQEQYTAVVANGKVDEQGLGTYKGKAVVPAQGALILHTGI